MTGSSIGLSSAALAAVSASFFAFSPSRIVLITSISALAVSQSSVNRKWLKIVPALTCHTSIPRYLKLSKA